MPKYIITLKFFCYLFPKKNYNKKTFSVWKKTIAISSRFACVLYTKSNPYFCTNI